MLQNKHEEADSHVDQMIQHMKARRTGICSRKVEQGYMQFLESGASKPPRLARMPSQPETSANQKTTFWAQAPGNQETWACVGLTVSP